MAPKPRPIKPANKVGLDYTWGECPGGQPERLWDYASRPLWAQTLPEQQSVVLLELERMQCRHAVTGAVQWEQPCKGLPDEMETDSAGMVQAYGNHLQELDPATGASRWRQRPGGPITALALDASTAYAATKGPLFAVDRGNGQVRWRTPCAWEPELYPRPEIGLVLVDDPEQEKLLALDTRTGEKRWEFAASGQPLATGAIVENAVLVSAYAEGLHALDAPSGQSRWRFKPDGTFEAPAVAVGDTVYATDGRVYALEAQTGAERWRYVPEDGDQVFGLRVNGEYLLAETWGGKLLALDLADGSVRWTHAYGQVHGVSGDAKRLYLRVHRNEDEGTWAALAVERETGERVWELTSPRMIPEVNRVGDAVIVEFKGAVLALRA